MKLLRLLFPVFLAASLSVLLSGKATANDHPWDDSTIDSSETTGYSQTEESVSEPDTLDSPISVKIKNWVLKFLRNIFGWGVKNVDVEEENGGGEKRGRLDVRRTFVNVRTRVV